MSNTPPYSLDPGQLPPGTEVGQWRVVAWAGQGMYGAVYRAVRVGREQSDFVALKVALLPKDPRFEREVELLWRVRHPSIPRLWEHGEWQSPEGTQHPYLVMDWVEGAPLYEWVGQNEASFQQAPRLLAQLAGALHVLHTQGGLHRDVKGENVQVRRADGRAVLMDVGSGWYAGAATLTPPGWFPGTPAYLSPESWLLALRHMREPQVRYSAGPADDVFSLGVTAYRLLTGGYPPLPEPYQDGEGAWHLEDKAPPAPHTLNPGVDERLSALVLRMLSVRPEERGSAKELAEALEQLVPKPEAAKPQPQPQEEPAARAEPVERRASQRRWPELAALAAGLALLVWAWWAAPREFVEQHSVAQEEPGGASQEDGGATGLGDAASTASTVVSPEPPTREVLAEDTPPEPRPGQLRPDAKGRCPHKLQVALNGACWVPLKKEREACEALSGHMAKGTCYVPTLAPGRQPTSNPEGPP